jgi:hypothetical protein
MRNYFKLFYQLYSIDAFFNYNWYLSDYTFLSKLLSVFRVWRKIKLSSCKFKLWIHNSTFAKRRSHYLFRDRSNITSSMLGLLHPLWSSLQSGSGAWERWALARSAHSHYPSLFDHRARNNNYTALVQNLCGRCHIIHTLCALRSSV